MRWETPLQASQTIWNQLSIYFLIIYIVSKINSFKIKANMIHFLKENVNLVFIFFFFSQKESFKRTRQKSPRIQQRTNKHTAARRRIKWSYVEKYPSCLVVVVFFNKVFWFALELKKICIPLFRMMNREDDPGVEVLLFDGHQNSKLALASQFVDHLLWELSRSLDFPGGSWTETKNRGVTHNTTQQGDFVATIKRLKN